MVLQSKGQGGWGLRGMLYNLKGCLGEIRHAIHRAMNESSHDSDHHILFSTSPLIVTNQTYIFQNHFPCPP